MKISYCEQRSEEWFEARKGHLTGSNAQCIAANGKGLESYVISILAEKYSNNKESFSNRHTERGVELEPLAKMTYEIEREKVEIVGFVEMDEYVLVSPDGLVGDEGGIEIKAPDDAAYFKLLLDGKKSIDQKYIWQCQMFLLVTGRKWIDLVFYNPNFDKNMLIFRIEPDLVSQEKLIIGIEKGKNIIKEYEKKYEQSNRI